MQAFKDEPGQKPRLLNEQEKSAAKTKLENTSPIKANAGVIKAGEGLTARQAAEKWAAENLPQPLAFTTEVGEVEFDKKSVKNSLAHGYNQAKLDAIPTLPEGFESATYLGSLHDFDGQPIDNHYFAYPVNYNGELCYVFCRARKDVNTNRLYVHEVFVTDKIKSSTLQTAAKLLHSKLHRGTALYKSILSDVLNAKIQQNSDNPKLSEEKGGDNHY